MPHQNLKRSVWQIIVSMLAIAKSPVPENKSQMYMLNNNGPNMEPCGMPLKMESVTVRTIHLCSLLPFCKVRC